MECGISIASGKSIFNRWVYGKSLSEIYDRERVEVDMRYNTLRNICSLKQTRLKNEHFSFKLFCQVAYEYIEHNKFSW